MTLLSVINGSTYLKKHNSLRKMSKHVKITKYVEQTLRKKSRLFLRAPCAKTYTRGVHEGGEGAQPLALIVALVWLLHVHRLHQFVSLGGS